MYPRLEGVWEVWEDCRAVRGRYMEGWVTAHAYQSLLSPPAHWEVNMHEVGM